MRHVHISGHPQASLLREFTVIFANGTTETIEVGPESALEVTGLACNEDGAPISKAYIRASFSDIERIELEVE